MKLTVDDLGPALRAMTEPPENTPRLRRAPVAAGLAIVSVMIVLMGAFVLSPSAEDHAVTPADSPTTTPVVPTPYPSDLFIPLPQGYRPGGGAPIPDELADCIPDAPEGMMLNPRYDVLQDCMRRYMDEHKGDPEAPNRIGTGPLPPQLVAQCTERFSSYNGCGLVLAIEEGKIPPGIYTDEELEEAVRAAGYEWKAAR